MKNIKVAGRVPLASLVLAGATFGALILGTGAAQGQGTGMPPGSCNVFGPNVYADLKAALDSAVAAEDSGFDFQMWATVVARDGTVCAVARSADIGDQWPGSRAISAQKANTANAFGLPNFAFSTANLYSTAQPGANLFGLQASNPVDPTIAYDGPYSNLGTRVDPLVGKRMGGINVFGGGLALYSENGIVGAVGASGDTSCADHHIAWRIRNNLGLDAMAGVSGGNAVFGDNDATRPDNIIYDITPNPSGGTGNSAGGAGHPQCFNTGDQTALPAVQQ